MEYSKYNITSLFLVGLLVAVAACDAITGDPDTPIPLKETLNTESTGAFLRILEVNTAAINIQDIPNAEYSFEGEVADSKDGQRVETVNFYVSFQTKDDSLDLEEAPDPVVSVSVSDLSVSEESGLPRGTFTIPAPDMLNALGLQESDLDIGDLFDIRMELVLEDGTTFTNTDVSPAVTGGFYSSPLFARAPVAVDIPDDKFTGSYTFTQNEPAPTVAWASQFTSDDNSEGWIWQSQSSPETFTVELKPDPENDLNGRVFEATYLEEWGYGPSQHAIAFGDGTVTMGRETNNGLGCGEDITVGAAPGTGNYDFDDDSQFTLVVLENAREDCGFSSTEVSFTVTKN